MSGPGTGRGSSDQHISGAAGAQPGRLMPRVVRRFIETEAAGGVVLLVAALAALVWANSPWSASYRTFWHTELSIGFGRYVFTETLQHWVNDGLMTVFFFVVGLEIKREMVHGELREPRVAAVPVIAALGGMVVPAVLYLAVTAGSAGAKGWGIPMATDIAFAMGVVALLGSRVPSSLKLFLLTLAIVDDIGAIIVIAVVYSSDVQPVYLLVAVVLLGMMGVMRRLGVVGLAPFVVLGVGVWLATQSSGVHATIAGVVLGLLAPARLAKTSVSPAERLENLLHPWTSFVIVPVFALANTGVVISADALDAPGTGVVVTGVVVGLVAGKVVGISLASYLAVRSGLGRLPEGATWPMLVGTAAVAGIGFTVSLFIAELAYTDGPLREAAKLGVLVASTIAAIVGAALLLRACRTRTPQPFPWSLDHRDRRAPKVGA